MTYDEAESSLFQASPVELYKFQSGDSIWRVTSADTTIDDDEQEYTPLAIRRSSAGQNAEQSSGALKLLLPADHQISQRFIAFAPATPMSLTIYRKHVGVDDRVCFFVGRVTAANFGDFCELTCEPDSSLLKRRIPAPRYQRQCNHILFDAGCGVDPAGFTFEATITSINGATLVSADFTSQPDQWLRNGYVEIGEQRRMVLDHQGDTVVVLGPFVGVTAPVSANAFAGCDRSFTECVSKFDNGARFLGFPWIPVRNPFKGLT